MNEISSAWLHRVILWAVALVCLVLLALGLAGCASTPAPLVHTTVQKVDVPVPTRAVPPAELVHCLDGLTPPVFQDTANGVGLTPDQIDALRVFVGRLVQCDRAWVIWAK